jgi:hypothetical protein
MAETTTISLPTSTAPAIISATFLIRPADPREVPPNLYIFMLPPIHSLKCEKRLNHQPAVFGI